MMCIFADKNYALIFEHKVNAPLRAGQLDDYRRIGERRFDQFAVVLITARRSQLDQDPDCHLLWRQVHGWVAKWLHDGSPDTAAAFVARNFLHLLQVRGVGPMEPITPQQLLAIPRAAVGTRRIRTLVKSAAQQTYWQDMVERFPDDASQGPLESDSRWGRCGMYLLGNRNSGSWAPGVFVGVVQDSSDHGPPSVGSHDGPGPAACLIVDVHRQWHATYARSEPYARLVQAFLRLWPLTGDDDWQVHQDSNAWHPLAVHKPLEIVLRAADSGDDQMERFVDDLRRIAQAVFELEELWAFRQSLHRER